MHELVLTAVAVLFQNPLPEPAPALQVSLAPPPADSLGLRWSPKGSKVALRASGAALLGHFALGHPGTREVSLRLEKSPAAEHHDLLWIDADRDGAFGEGERLSCTPSEQRGKWWSSFDAVLDVPLAADKQRAEPRPYPVSLWFVEDPLEPEAAPLLRWSRRGWSEGQLELSGRPAFVLVTEMQMDGVIDQRDAWAIARERESLLRAPARALDNHVWLDGVAYRACAIDADGERLAFEPFDPGISEAEEAARADSYAVDRQAERAAAPLAFGKQLAAALETAKSEGRHVFVDFQTTWCGPCRQMEQWVYTAKDVVEAARRVVPVVLDGDEQRALVKQYQVGAYPTMLLLDSDGEVLRRAVGYQSVAAMVAFLREGDE